jgi:murein DD-endopeptidase MepM/ murein hydrolase activator NlpD
MKAIVALLLFAISAGDLEQRAREMLAALVAKQYAEVAANFNATMLAALPPEKLRKTFEETITPQIGAFQRVIEAKRSSQNGFEIVELKTQYEKAICNVRIIFDSEKKVAGLFVRPIEAAPTRLANYTTKTTLRLPFDGEWFVFWGGRTREQNYHVVTADQRFAYDLVIMRDGSTHHGNEKLNTNYYCWDSPIHTPADGVVTEAVDGIADNIPGVMNPGAPAGNHLVIDHRNGEFSLLAHFRNGTVVPKAGDKVKRGMVIGRCGNSGNSSEPHLHYHLQNGPHFGQGEGLPAQFTDYVADGKETARGEPTRGQKISNP